MNANELFRDFAIHVGRVSFLKKLFRKPYDAYLKAEHNARVSRFKKYGFDALRLFDNCLTTYNIPYSLAFGTLLGAVREHDFIPHDDDIDVAMWIDDYTPDIIQYLKEVGIKLKYSFSVDDDKYAKLDTFEYHGVMIDIFYFYKDENGESYCCDFVNQPGCINRSSSLKRYGGLLPRKIYVPLGSEIMRTNFKGIEVHIPTNYKEILSFRYGEDYMTPKPGWRPKTKYIIEVPDKIGVYVIY